MNCLPELLFREEQDKQQIAKARSFSSAAYFFAMRKWALYL